MKETFYFPHDYNATQDPKMMAVLSACGLGGLAMYWILIEILHQQPESKILYESYKDYISFYGRKDGENEHLLNKVEQMLITTGLLLKDDRYIYSERVIGNKKERQRLSELRSLAGKKSAEVRANSTSVQQKRTSVEQLKERKGKEIKRNIHTVCEVAAPKVATLQELVEPLKSKYDQKMIKEFLNYWTEKNPNGKKEKWQMQKIFDPARRLVTWAGKEWNKPKSISYVDEATGKII